MNKVISLTSVINILKIITWVLGVELYLDWKDKNKNLYVYFHRQA